MSERKPKYIVKKITADSVPAAEPAENKENAPAAEATAPNAESVKKKKKKGKKNRRGRMSVRLAAVLMIFAMLFGVVVGYAIGRSAGANRLVAAEQRVNELTEATEEAGRTEIDIFTDNLSAANREALADLSGLSMQSGDNNVFLGGDDFTGISASAETNPVVVAEFNGGTLMSDEVSRRYNEALAGYIFSGYTEAEVSADLLSRVMEEMVTERVLQAQAEKLGLYELTEADKQQISAAAQAEYDAQLALYKSFVYADGMTDADANAAAAAFLLDAEGMDLGSIRAGIEKDWWQRKLRSAVTSSAQLDSSAILAAYNEKLSEQKERFSASPAAFESAQREGEVILYNLAGYRMVRPLMLKLSDAQIETAAQLTGAIALMSGDAQQLGEAQAQLDALYAPLEARANEILGMLNSGYGFDSLLSQYGEDEGMKNPGLKASGYYISADSALWDSAVIEAAMAFTAPGEISGVIRTADGVCILQYAGEVQGGEVDMAKVYDAMTAEARTTAQDKAYSDQKAAWLAEANAKYYPERMQ